jgi:phosphoribosylformylglycinamidine synthase
MKFGVVIFPGSNCDYDSYQAIKTTGIGEVSYLWHGESSVNDCDVVILPGGFSYGDYLRSGAIARFSPIMKAIIDYAKAGGIVIGICNGFQILLEAGLLPGAMRKNLGMRFVCRDVYLRVLNTSSRFTSGCIRGKVLKIPIAHAEGNYFVDKDTLNELYETNRVIFKYCDEKGNTAEEANPNGSLDNIAGIMNKEGNVLGMMPHPERACEMILGSEDGRCIFESLAGSFEYEKA